MLKIPYGITDYKKLKEEGYYYVDKTMYLQKLEDVGMTLVYLRPSGFGKTILTSMMNYYYDVNSEYLFDGLFKDTYVYNNPTKNKNNYYILKIDFSGMNVLGEEGLEREFIKKVADGISKFNENYGFNFDTDYNNITPNGLLLEFLGYFSSLNLDHKLYIIIDEYDSFVSTKIEDDGVLDNEFKGNIGNQGFVKAFYTIIKQYCGLGIVYRVFITGKYPIYLDTLSGGFNISTDISTDIRFNEMIGLTHEEVKYLIKDIDESKREEIFDLMIKNYDGYLFSKKAKTRVFNATLVMYFLNKYYDFNEIPDELMDTNIAFNYGKIGNLLKLQDNIFYKEILDTILKTGTIKGELKLKFNLELKFKRDDIISLLYYFGYLTIKEISFGSNIVFSIPNHVMNKLYTNYFLELLEQSNDKIDLSNNDFYLEEIILEGKINKVTNYIEKILKLSDNRIFMKFDEKYVQLLYFSLLIGKKEFYIYNEYQCSNGYIDLMLVKNMDICKYDIMIELKYLKVREYRRNRKLLDIKREEAIEQLKSYSDDNRIDKSTLKRYAIVFVGNDAKVIEEV